MHSRSPFPWNSIPTTQNILSTPWTFVNWKMLASVLELPVLAPGVEIPRKLLTSKLYQFYLERRTLGPLTLFPL
uniref:Uncharacterized protein n=1 Tax=Urocitellus parryii TaxID=9999 RepID=A0A8D2IUI1_UROPR